LKASDAKDEEFLIRRRKVIIAVIKMTRSKDTDKPNKCNDHGPSRWGWICNKVDGSGKKCSSGR
jgi:hypothetical protein